MKFTCMLCIYDETGKGEHDYKNIGKFDNLKDAWELLKSKDVSIKPKYTITDGNYIDFSGSPSYIFVTEIPNNPLEEELQNVFGKV